MDCSKQEETTKLPENSLLREADEDNRMIVTMYGKYPRIAYIGYKGRRIAKQRRRLYRVSPEDKLKRKKIVKKHKLALRKAGLNPKKYLNLDSKP